MTEQMRQSYERYLKLFAPLMERNGIDDALMRGAFAAGATYGLAVAELKPAAAAAALDRLNEQLGEFWHPAKKAN